MLNKDKWMLSGIFTHHDQCHIMLTILTIMLILYAHKMLLLCSKSSTIMLQNFPRITHVYLK